MWVLLPFINLSLELKFNNFQINRPLFQLTELILFVASQ